MNILSVLLLLVISSFAFSQQKTNQNLWHLTIADSATAKGIARVTIAISSKKYFTTDVDGSITIDKSLIDLNDKIRVSCIGYKPVLLKPDINHKFPDTIRLFASVTLIKEVKINSTQPTKITLESIKTSHDTHMHPYPNHEFAQYIPNQEKLTGTITSVEFELNDDLHAIEMPFNVEILSKSTDSIYPDTAMIMDSIIVYNPKKKRHLSVELSKYHIQIPENGFLLSFKHFRPLIIAKRLFGMIDVNITKFQALISILKRKINLRVTVVILIGLTEKDFTAYYLEVRTRSLGLKKIDGLCMAKVLILVSVLQLPRSKSCMQIKEALK